ncbi:MAG: tRNA (adenosine(37)-N6)-threonylcarbamoyltransferase complex ATPase subunit type 1 TsaE [Oscillospiraceae bacterium]|nr:tRNA (adenosine(37)-N6)-threonylcarbamoyltransferase complex ATPase subunit type 1 TsaE [Oscillospiraceae bacterium]
MTKHITNSEKETRALAADLAKALRPGDVVAFRGGLGVGKTAFVRGLAEGLGIADNVSSPTFALVHEYRSKTAVLCHFDMYRAFDSESLHAAGFFDYLDSGAFLAVEWSENIARYLPENTIIVSMEHGGGDIRVITIEKGGAP